MKLRSLSPLLGPAAILLLTPFCDAKSSHHKLHQLERRNHHFHGALHSRAEHGSTPGLTQKRGQQCQFPTDDPNLHAVSPDQMNAGWAMSPDQQCKPGSYCLIACKPGMVMAQWDPDSSYTFPVSMNGGLFCDDSGKIQKPFPDQPNCVHGTGTVQVINNCKAPMSWCQTVLPGNEAMLIPTIVDRQATLAVPGPSYWCSTSAHYYINPPGTGAEGCVWGDSSNPVGNWSPYVAGANTDPQGQTFVKLGWNPIWQSSGLKHQKPSFGVKIECPDGGCNGLPCQIDPSSSHNGVVDSLLAAVGAGDAAFCVVTVAKGKTANIVAYDGSGGRGSSPSTPAYPASAPAEKVVSPAPSSEPKSAPPSSSPKTTSTSATTTTTSTSSTTSTTTTSTSTPPKSSPATTSQAPTTQSTPSARITPLTISNSTSTTTSTSPSTSLYGGVFHENGTVPVSGSTVPTTSLAAPVPKAPSAQSQPPFTGAAARFQGSSALLSLVLTLVATACFV